MLIFEEGGGGGGVNDKSQSGMRALTITWVVCWPHKSSSVVVVLLLSTVGTQ